MMQIKTLILGLLLLPFLSSGQSITSISPDQGKKGTTFSMIINGSGNNWINTGYSYQNIIFSGTYVEATNANVLGQNVMSCTLDIAHEAIAGQRDVTVTYDDGFGNISTVIATNGFTVVPSQLLAASPDNEDRAAHFPITITGRCTNWPMSGYVFSLVFENPGVTASNIVVADTSILTADVSIANNAIDGPTALMVNFGPRTDTLDAGFKVNLSSITSVDPDTLKPGETATLTITGSHTNWQNNPGMSAIVLINNATIDQETVVDDTTMTCEVTIDSPSTIGFRDITVIYDDSSGSARTDGKTNALYIDSIPTIPDGIAITDLYSLSVYPNPFSGDFTISFSQHMAGNVVVELFDISGKGSKILYATWATAGNHKINVIAEEYKLSQGIYILRFSVNETELYENVMMLR
ncbi:MAG: T9SS type A sorting domain-containing protein [Bacteroidetes bacterium]|nr:T9SS type A sorting domain-containing protein [Bacteroidota bacterium]